jgi:polysaccharide export outer membrane protein
MSPREHPPRPFSTALLASALVSLLGCGSGRYVWIDDVKSPRAEGEYVIAQGDLVSVRVFNQESMSTRVRVRSDGKIAVPLVGDVDATGKTPAALSRELAGRFKEYVVSPMVTTTVEETQPTSVSVLGEVTHAGIYTLDASAGVLQALAAAGGFTEYASRDAIYVVRRAPVIDGGSPDTAPGAAAEPPPRVRFTFSSLVQGGGRAAAFRLHAGDVVVVE